MRTALVCGVSGQDGAYLAKLLIDKGYHVVGTSRDAQVTSFANLQRLGVKNEVERCSMVLTDFRSILQTLTRTQPDEVYNLAGQSSVSHSFDQPVETMESVSLGALNLLEAVRFLRSQSAFTTQAPQNAMVRLELRAPTKQRRFAPEVPTLLPRQPVTGQS